jgi:hypothetical protein
VTDLRVEAALERAVAPSADARRRPDLPVVWQKL